MQADTPKARATRIREMFSHIAPRYDLLNHLLSLNIDRGWRRATTKALAPVMNQPGTRVLDLCCGTGDLALALGHRANAQIFGVDFSHAMLVRAKGKSRERNSPISLAEADALRLPFRDQQFDAVALAFGFRNLVDREAGLQEIRRILKPGGRLAILEFSQPDLPIFRSLFGIYFRFALPRIGGAISGSPSAYRYLHDSVQAFPSPASLAAMIEAAGFDNVRHRNLSGGIAALHTGQRID